MIGYLANGVLVMAVVLTLGILAPIGIAIVAMVFGRD